MLNESMPTASASTASSTVLRITTSPLSSRPDASRLMGTNESNPNSMSWALLTLRFLPADRSPVPRRGSVIPFAVTNTSSAQFIAYASTDEAGLGGSSGPADRRGSSRQARPRGLGSPTRGSRDVHAPAPDRPREQNRPGLERLRRNMPIGPRRRRPSED